MDMHCHLLWGVDDGAHILRDSLEIISRLKEKGFRGAYCTPHISSRYPSNTPARLKARFQQLLDALPDRDFDLRLAAEYMLDHHFEQALEEEEPLSHDGSHLLVELPQFRLPSAWRDRLQLVQEKGFVPVLAHPERYGKIMPPEELAALASQGISFQGNIGSLFGLYGKSCQAAAGNSRRKTCTCGGEQTPTMPTCSPNSACNPFSAGKGGTPAFSLHPPP